MEVLELGVETAFHHHMEAFGNNDLEELLKDYTEESELWMPDATYVGLEAIAGFFTFAFTLFPKGATKLEIVRQVIKDDRLYIVWNADSPVVSVPFASDSFLFKDGKIVWQTVAPIINMK